MKLSVIILNYNVRYFLELCIKSVLEATKTIDAEIIVVDNTSTDHSCDMVKTQFPEVHLIENKTNYGFSKGNNIGVSKAKGQYVCILNPDTVVAEDTFTALLRFADTTPNLGILGSQLIDGKGQFLPESKRCVPKPLVAFKKLIGNTKAYYSNTVKEEDIAPVDILPGAFMMIKKEIYNTVNGFDEDYFMYGEDIDLSYTIQKQGYTNYYHGKTVVIHYKGESTLKDKTYAKRFYNAMQIFYKKHFKSHVLSDALVTAATQIIPLLRKPKPAKQKQPEHYILFSKEENKDLKAVINYTLHTTYKIDPHTKNICYIFDNNCMSFKTIIEIMHTIHLKNNCTFKILPKQTCFLIGSNSSVHQGEVIHF